MGRLGDKKASHGAGSLTDHVWVQNLLNEHGADGCWHAPYKQVMPGKWFVEMVGSSAKVGIRRYMWTGYFGKDPGKVAFVTTCGTTGCCNPKHLQIKGSESQGETPRGKHLARSVGRPAAGVSGRTFARRVFVRHLTLAAVLCDPKMAQHLEAKPADVLAVDDIRLDDGLMRGLKSLVDDAWGRDDIGSIMASPRSDVLEELADALGKNDIDDDDLMLWCEPAEAFVLSCADRLGITLVA